MGVAVVQILLTKTFEKQVKRLPSHIRNAIFIWMDVVKFQGLMAARRVRGYNDELLKGKRRGQRSIRLNRAYRLIYEENNGELTIITILEVHKHDY